MATGATKQTYMKRYSFSILLVFLLTIGCQEEISIKKGCFRAVIESFQNSVKTAMDEERNVVWSKGDMLAVFQPGTSACKYQITDASVGKEQGEFIKTGTEERTDGENIAFYPYMDGLECHRSGNSYQITNIIIPETQSYAAKSFGNGTLLMATVSNDMNLKFKNILGAIKFQFTGTDKIQSIEIQGNDNEKLSGKASATVYSDNSDPVIIMEDDASGSVRLDCGEGVLLDDNEATTFIITLPPVTFTKGFKVILTNTSNMTTTLEATAENTVSRSTILSMPEVNVGGMTHYTFKESDEIIANPERGFYSARSSGYPLTASDITSNRVNKITLFYIGYQIPADAKIPESSSDKSITSISRIRNEMQLLRDGGAKCILRFAYSDSEEEKPWDATPQWVAEHISQIKPILQEYSDVIMTFQAGFVGVWGEWYYTDNFVFNPQNAEEHALRKEVVDAMLEALPADRSVALRTPMFKRWMYAESYTDTLTVSTAYDGSAKSRIGCFNDCFGASSTDYGTFEDEETREFWKKDTRYVFMGGETCGVSDYCKCEQSLTDMEDYHWSYLNSDYNKSVIARWEETGCLDEIKQRLGYRLSLTEVYHSEHAVAGKRFNVNIGIRNTGFAAPMNPRDVELVLVSNSGQKTIFELDDVDPRYWFANGTYNISETITLPAEASGSHSMYLNLPDPKTTLRNNPKFSIRLANDNIWEDSTGYNRLFDLNISEDTPEDPSDPDSPEIPDVPGHPASGEDISFGTQFNPWK